MLRTPFALLSFPALLSVGAATAQSSPLNWEGAIGLSVSPIGQCEGDESLSASTSHKLSEQGCERVKLIVTVSGMVEKVDSGFDVVSVNGVAVFEGDDSVEPDCGQDMMTQKSGSVVIEVGPGESITLNYSTNDGLYNAGAQAQITNIVESPIQGDCESCSGGSGAAGNAGGNAGTAAGGTKNFGGSTWGSNNSGQSAFAVGVGGTSSAYGAPSMYAEANPANANSGSRSGLSYVGPDEDHIAERVLDGGGVLSQIKGKSGLIALEDSVDGYEMRFYNSSQIGSFDPILNKYPVTGSAAKVIAVSRQVSGSVSTVSYTETVGAGAPVMLWSNSVNAASNTQTSNEYSGRRITVTQKTTLSSTRRKERITVKSIISSVETVYAVTEKIYETFGWGEELVEEARDPDGANLRTVSAFYSNPTNDGDSYGRLRSVTYADGGWVIYKDYDANGLAGKAVSSIGSNVFDSSQTGEDNNRLDVLVITGVDEDGDLLPDETRERSRYVKGQLVGRTWETRFTKPESLGIGTINFSGQVLKRHHETASGSGVSRGDSSNALAVELYDVFSDQRIVRTSAEGVSDLSYSYHYESAGVRLPRVYTASGRLDSGGSYFLAGTIEEQGEDETGNITRVVRDANGATLFSQYPSSLDSKGRAQRMDYHDGSYETYVYGCCGLDERRNRDGSRTVFLRDGLNRVNESITYVDDVFVSAQVSEMDPVGRIVRTLRRASATDTSPQVTGKAEYDLAGRLELTKDGEERPTAYTYTVDGSGRPVLTITYPGGGTRIETREKDGQLVSVAGTAAAPVSYAEDVDTNGRYRMEYRIGDGGAQTEWTRTDFDFMGRAWKTSFPYPAGAATTRYFDKDGRVIRAVDADGISTLTRYDQAGRVEYVVADLNANGDMDAGGTDRITRYAYDTEYVAGQDGVRVTTYVAVQDGSSSERQVSRVTSRYEDQVVLRSENSAGTVSRDYEYREHDYVVTDTLPDGRTIETVWEAGRKTTEIITKGTIVLSSFGYQYDSYNRLWKVTDTAFGTTTYAYYDDDQMQSVTTADPDPTQTGEGYEPQVTSYTYDTAGMLRQTTLPDDRVETRSYYPNGKLNLVYGGEGYPHKFSYDPQGRTKTLTTWQDFNETTQTGTGAAVTTWNYHPSRGWLDAKIYQNNLGPSYTYTPAGRLEVRTWARTIGGSPLTTTYGYNDAGGVEGVDYSDATPDVEMVYDREGRLSTMTDAAGLLTRTYTANNQLDDETYSGTGLLAGRSIARGFDGYLRPQSVATGSDYSVVWGYSSTDARLETITYNTHFEASYGYRSSSSLKNSVSYKNGGTLRGGVAMDHDALARITRVDSTASAAPGGIAARRDYRHDEMGRRKVVTGEDDSYWSYGYDALGQLNAADKRDDSDAVIPGYSYGLTYDDIGNRLTATRGTHVDTYQPDLLNQYTRRTTAGMVEVRGNAAVGLTVIVNDQPTTRSGDYFYRATEIPGNTSPVNLELKIQAVQLTPTTAVATETRAVRLNPSDFMPQYDSDGNPTNQGMWVYGWDAENRLISAETATNAVGEGTILPRMRLEFAYDGFSRRIGKTVKVWNSTLSMWEVTQERRYLYDQWNKIVEFNPLASGATVLRHVWGLDASGSAQGAGGVGGLLFTQNASGVYAPGYDANGNILTWSDMATGAVAGRWEYGPFGETLTMSGVARDLPHSFSTKHRDVETGLFDYGYRSYDASLGRFLGRDSSGESGGLNLFAFVKNNSINLWDLLGLVDCEALRKQLGVAQKVYANQMKNFEPGGDYADKIGLLDGTILDNISNTNALTGLGVGAVGASVANSLAKDGASGPYGQTYYSGSTPWQGQKIAMAGTALGVAGIGIDAYQATNAFSSGDNLGGIKSTASGALGGIGLAIAGSNPITATAAGVGALAINAAEAGANAYLNYRDEQWRQENAGRSASLLKNAANKIRNLNDQLIQGGCMNCVGQDIK